MNVLHLDTSLSAAFLFTLLQTFLQSHAEIFHCLRDEEVTIITNSSGSIITLYEGQTIYDNNQKCTWIIDAGEGENRGIALKVTKSHLEWAPDKSSCYGYDYVEVLDGKTSESNSIVKWCGEKNPYDVSSSGRYLHITFSTNEKNQYEYGGAIIEFQTFETSYQLGGCQPGWFDYPSLSSGGTSCFSVKTHKQSWIEAQKYCNYEQANLFKTASYDDGERLNGILKNMSSVSATEDIWLGLNDITVDSEYRWPDSSLLNMTPLRWRNQPHSSDSYLNCVTMKSEDGLWAEQFGNENDIHTVVKYKFVCEKNKVGTTSLYTIPEGRKKSSGGLAEFPVLVWAVPVAVVIVALVIIIGIVVYKKKQSAAAMKGRARQGCNAQSESLHLSRTSAVQPRAPVYTAREEAPVSIAEVHPERRRSPPPSYEMALSQTTTNM